MNNEITYTRDGLSQDDCNIPALSEKYYLLSPEKLSDIIVRLGVYAKDSPVDVCNNKTFTFLCFIISFVIKDGNRVLSINEVRVVLMKLLKIHYTDQGLYKGWFTNAERTLRRIERKLLDIRNEHFGPELDENYIVKLDEAFILVSDLLDSLKIDAELLYNEIISKDTFEPSYALYITTAKLLKHFQDRINNFPDRRIDFYYQKVLGFSPKQAKGDTVNLVIPNVAKGNSAVLPKGTRFDAGTTQNGDEVVFETTEDTSVNDAKVQQIFTMGEPSKKVEIPVYDLSQFPFKENLESFPLFGKSRTRKNQSESGTAQASSQSTESNKTPQKSGYGYAFASEVFRMEDGDRRILIKLDLDSDVEICKDQFINYLNPNDVRTSILKNLGSSSTSIFQKNVAELIDKNINDCCIEKKPFKPMRFDENNPFTSAANAKKTKEEVDSTKKNITSAELLRKNVLINDEPQKINEFQKQLITYATKDITELLNKKNSLSQIASIEQKLNASTERFYGNINAPCLFMPRISVVSASSLLESSSKDKKAKEILDLITSGTSESGIKTTISASITTEKGWYNVPESDFSFDVKLFVQTKKCNLTNSIVTNRNPACITYLKKKIYSLVFDIKIPDIAGKTAPYNPEVHGYSWKTKLPVLYLSFNTTVPETLSYLLDQSFENTEVHTVVKNCRNVTVENDFGKMDASKPFLPFGSIPRDGSSFTLGCPEFRNKTIDGFIFKAKWANISEDAFDPDCGIYKGYLKRPTKASLKAKVSYLKDGAWSKVTDPKELFYFKNKKKGCTKIKNDFCVATVQQRLSSSEELSVSADEFVFDNQSKTGFLKLILDTNEVAFGHNIYALSISNYLMQQSFSVTDRMGKDLSKYLSQTFVSTVETSSFGGRDSEPNRGRAPEDGNGNNGSPEGETNNSSNTQTNENFDKIIDYENVPKEPYTPILEDLYVNYNAYAVLNPLPEAEATEDRMFFLQPFGECYNPPKPDVDSALYIGFSCTALPKILSLFFHLNQDSAPFCRRTLKGFTWRYLASDGWKDLLSTKIIKDSTFYFTQSGIVSIRLPNDIVNDNPLMPTGLYWIKVIPDDNMWRQCCSLFSIYAQGVEAVRVCGFEGSPEAPLVPRCKSGTISKIINSIAGLNEVCQLADSFGGAMPESNQRMRLRVAERLYHHNRAVSIRDIERMVLQKFPEVAKVKCFGRLDFDQFDKFKPGSILIVPIAPVVNKDYFKWNPRFNAKTLFEIRDYVKKHISGSVDVKVANPYFEKIKVCGTVKISEECDIEEKKKELINALGEYISPWYATGNHNHFGWRLLKGNIESYIYDFDYVKDVENFRLEQVGIEDDAQKITEQESEKNTFTNSYPWSVAVPVFDDFFKVEIQ